MIPIECPKCGREGNVPPDRLNAKLTCRGCQAVFHLDNTGRMVMGPPGDPDQDRKRSYVSYNNKKGGSDFNLSETLANIPIAVKIGVPVALLAVLGYMFMPSGGGPNYQSGSEAIVRGLLDNNRSTVVSYGTSESAEATGKWFDLVHAETEKQGVPADSPVNPALFSGNPEKDGSIVMMVVLSGSSASALPLALNLHMVRSGSSWRLDGEKTLSDAAQNLKAAPKK